VLFAFSVTPKKFLHDWVAKHKDTPGKFSHDPQARLQKATYNCHTEDQVVESPFEQVPSSLVLQAPLPFSTPYILREANWHSFFQVFFSLRGPPAIV